MHVGWLSWSSDTILIILDLRMVQTGSVVTDGMSSKGWEKWTSSDGKLLTGQVTDFKNKLITRLLNEIIDTDITLESAIIWKHI